MNCNVGCGCSYIIGLFKSFKKKPTPPPEPPKPVQPVTPTPAPQPAPQQLGVRHGAAARPPRSQHVDVRDGRGGEREGGIETASRLQRARYHSPDQQGGRVAAWRRETPCVSCGDWERGKTARVSCEG